jgi:homoserine acetyltransferase
MRQKLVNNMRISSIRVHYRYPTHLDESIIDIIAGIESLEHAGIQPVGFVGHSLGGSVVIEAAAAVPNIIRTVVTLYSKIWCSRHCISIKTMLLYSTNIWY